MASLTEIFNPTFLIFLGVLFLVVALLVVYFESKMREQNHKIASMLSLVSTMAEEMNGINMRFNSSFVMPNMTIPSVGGTNTVENNRGSLIPVSDDSDNDTTDEEDTDDDMSDSDTTEDNDEEDSEIEISNNNSETIEIGTKHNDVKILKLNNVLDDKENNLDINIEDLNESNDDDSEDDVDESEDDDLSSKSDEIAGMAINDIDGLEEIKEDTTNGFIKSLNLKTINLDNLEQEKESNDNSLDYKKMAIGKLRSIITEKGLHEDPSKLKKQDLLKLLGEE